MPAKLFQNAVSPSDMVTRTMTAMDLRGTSILMSLEFSAERQCPPTADQNAGQLGSGGTLLEYTLLRQTRGAVSG